MKDVRNVRQDFNLAKWAQSSLGQTLFAMEQNALQKYLPALHGETAVQVALPGIPAMLGASAIEHKFLMVDGQLGSFDDELTEADTQLFYASAEHVLPFASSSVDLCLLPHTLDFTNNPHNLLRECKESLVSGGHLLILGFNPYSLWGARKLFSRQAPWNGNNFAVYRIRDWLSLLDFHICGGMMLYYSPPVENPGLRERFTFMEKAGDRWWPMLAGVYLLVAQKRDAGMTVIDFRESFKKKRYLNIAEPAAKNCTKHGDTAGMLQK